jgi:hypothetical protein
MTNEANRGWFVAALLLTAAVSGLLLISLLEREGRGIIVTLAIPVVVCAVPLVTPQRYRGAAAWVSTALLAAGTILALLSIGIFFVPSVVLLAIGAARHRSEQAVG